MKELDIIVTTRQIAVFYDVSTRTIQYWGRQGCPKLSRNLWPLKEVNLWWAENILGVSDYDSEDIHSAKVAYWKAKGEYEQIRVGKLRNELFSKSEVYRAWAWRVMVVKQGLLNFADRLSSILEKKSRKEISIILENEVRDLLNAFAKKGKYCHDTKTK